MLVKVLEKDYSKAKKFVVPTGKVVEESMQDEDSFVHNAINISNQENLSKKIVNNNTLVETYKEQNSFKF